ncbi:hypothetical protein C8F01DRAFT_1067664 [Mycena amicta]|nr:hypothetical protein C8F01DRAFT_1067664 [Mycena amicta]
MSSPPFTFFVSLLREISCSDSPPLRVFGRWVSRLRADFPQLAEGSTVTLFRLLFPEDDSRRKYDMQEARLASAIADCLGTSAKPLRAWATATSGCLGAEVLTVMQRCSLNVEFSPLTMANVDQLLDELAANSGFTCASIRKDYPIATRRNKETILRALYRCLAPLDAAWLTQILLKDLRPMLYPLSATHYSRALKAYNSVSVAELSKEEAMKVWDPSGRLLHCYRVRSRIDDAASAFEAGGPLSFNPQIGQPVPIPKARKGRGCEDALAPLRSSKEIWAETKYDGERAQIHVELCGQRTPRITIFSKSLRDSTWDRYGIHALILEALALQPGSETSSVTSNIILDAEMVAWHGDKIDEFWRIHSLVEHTARSARKTILIETDEIYTQDSLKTDVSERHLGLVFFDILLLNSTSLLSTPYSSRRSLLESVIRPLPTRAMLANRTNIVLEDNSLGVTIESTLASSIASGEEGLMLKAAEGRYNDHRYPCVKLKADYIRGYGDSLDFVLLAVGWDKERARLLRVSTDCFTTFYFGALRNEAELEKDPSARPHFYLFFTSSYGLSRDELEETNFFLKSTESVPFSATHPVSTASSFCSTAHQMQSSQSLRFTFTILRGLTPPSRILVNPLLCELLGAGFTKSPKSRSYELRFPRIAKLFRPHQRHWNEGVTLNALHLIARESMSRDRSDKDLDDWGNAAWNKPVSPAAAQKRKATTEKWHDKLISHPKNRRRKSLHSEFTMRTIAPLTTTSRANVEVPRATHIVVAMTEDAPGSRPVDALPSSMQSAAVFLATRNKKLRRHWQRITPAHNIVHSLESLFQACGWVEEDVSSSTSSPSVRRGIILLAVDEQLAHREDLVSAMQERKLLCAGRPHLKSIWLLEKDSHDSA